MGFIAFWTLLINFCSVLYKWYVVFIGIEILAYYDPVRVFPFVIRSGLVLTFNPLPSKYHEPHMFTFLVYLLETKLYSKPLKCIVVSDTLTFLYVYGSVNYIAPLGRKNAWVSAIFGAISFPIVIKSGTVLIFNSWLAGSIRSNDYSLLKLTTFKHRLSMSTQNHDVTSTLRCRCFISIF